MKKISILLLLLLTIPNLASAGKAKAYRYGLDDHSYFGGKTVVETTNCRTETEKVSQSYIDKMLDITVPTLFPEEPLVGDTFAEHYAAVNNVFISGEYKDKCQVDVYDECKFLDPLSEAVDGHVPLLLFMDGDDLVPGAYVELYVPETRMTVQTDKSYQYFLVAEDMKMVYSGNLKSDPVPEPFCGALVLGLAALALRRR